MDSDSPTLWIRPEDAEHPKLARLRRALAVQVGPEKGIDRPWLTWGTGLSREWLRPMLEQRAQVLVLPPWPQGGFAGLPEVKMMAPPGNELELDGGVYRVAATKAMVPNRAWRGRGMFRGAEAAWLVWHEPYVGAGGAWLCTAEFLLANPKSRPGDVRRLLVALVEMLTARCRSVESGVADQEAAKQDGEPPCFQSEDASYLLALLRSEDGVDAESVVRFLRDQMNVTGSVDKARVLLGRDDVRAWLSRPVGERNALAEAVDRLGFRAFRVDLEETVL